MKIIKDKITKDELKQMSKKMFDSLVKAVVDTESEIMCVDGELHSDEEQMLLKDGSKQKNLWGINLYPDFDEENFIEFDSMINIRPSQNNRTRSVDDPKIQKKIIDIVKKIVKQ